MGMQVKIDFHGIFSILCIIVNSLVTEEDRMSLDPLGVNILQSKHLVHFSKYKYDQKINHKIPTNPTKKKYMILRLT